MKWNLVKSGVAAVAAGFIGTSVLLASDPANACPRSMEQLICPGDPVVSDDGLNGTVLGVNPYRGTVAFRSSGGYTYTRVKETMALGEGCLEGYCVGDTVVTSQGIPGTLIGVNPYRRTVALKSIGGYNYVEGIEKVALGLGCTGGICVNDRVVSDNGIEGTVMAVNRYDLTVAFKSQGGYIYTKPADSLSTSEYCDQYGSFARSERVYPRFDEKAYLRHDFHFSQKRPSYPQDNPFCHLYSSESRCTATPGCSWVPPTDHSSCQGRPGSPSYATQFCHIHNANPKRCNATPDCMYVSDYSSGHCRAN